MTGAQAGLSWGLPAVGAFRLVSQGHRQCHTGAVYYAHRPQRFVTTHQPTNSEVEVDDVVKKTRLLPSPISQFRLRCVVFGLGCAGQVRPRRSVHSVSAKPALQRGARPLSSLIIHCSQAAAPRSVWPLAVLPSSPSASTFSNPTTTYSHAHALSVRLCPHPSPLPPPGNSFPQRARLPSAFVAATDPPAPLERYVLTAWWCARSRVLRVSELSRGGVEPGGGIVVSNILRENATQEFVEIVVVLWARTGALQRC